MSQCNNRSTDHSIGGFNRLSYDNCAYEKNVSDSTSPLSYQIARYKYENCSRCTHDNKQWAPFDLVDFESELMGIKRTASKCVSNKYAPDTQKTPVIYPANLCPVVTNNIKKMTNPGYSVPAQNFCSL